MDFLCVEKNRYAGDAASVGRHFLNVTRLSEILLIHPSFAEKYFLLDEVTPEKQEKFAKKYMKMEIKPQWLAAFLPFAPVDKDSWPRPAIPRPDGRIVELILIMTNKLRLFKEPLTMDHFDAYYDGEDMTTVVSVDNNRTVYFFMLLAEKEIIGGNWMDSIENGGMIEGPRGGVFGKGLISSTKTRCGKNTKEMSKMREEIQQMITPEIAECEVLKSRKKFRASSVKSTNGQQRGGKKK